MFGDAFKGDRPITLALPLFCSLDSHRGSSEVRPHNPSSDFPSSFVRCPSTSSGESGRNKVLMLKCNTNDHLVNDNMKTTLF